MKRNYCWMMNYYFEQVEVNYFRLMVEVVEFLVREGHALLERPAPLGLPDLKGCPWVVQAPGTPMREAIAAEIIDAWNRKIAPDSPGELFMGAIMVDPRAVPLPPPLPPPVPPPPPLPLVLLVIKISI